MSGVGSRSHSLSYADSTISKIKRGAPFDVQTGWLSFETPDITEATAWLSDHGVSPIQVIEAHEGGSDVIIQGVEGNLIQVVEYLEA